MIAHLRYVVEAPPGVAVMLCQPEYSTQHRALQAEFSLIVDRLPVFYKQRAHHDLLDQIRCHFEQTTLANHYVMSGNINTCL